MPGCGTVCTVQCVWALALAHRRRRGSHDRRAWELEQRVIALMRGLLRAMLRQASKVERFKVSLDPRRSAREIRQQQR